jgi:tetratricopeptide (TPR) repeat protein
MVHPPDLDRLRELLVKSQFAAIVEAFPVETDTQVADYPLEALYILSKSLRFTGAVSPLLRVTRDLIRRAPDQLEAHLQLVDALRLVGDTAGLEAAFAAALDRFPAAPPLLVRWVALALLADDSDEAERRLRLAREAAPENLAMADLEAQIATRRHDFSRAASLYEAAIPGQPEQRAVLLKKAALLRLYDRIAKRIASASKAIRSPDYAVLVINLDEHTDRLKQFMAPFAEVGPTVHRVPGVRGRHLPDLAAARLTDKDGPDFKGTLGCFLAHVAAWERMLTLDLPHALITEDDAHLVLPLPANTATLDLPPDYDLCFVNRGLELPSTASADDQGNIVYHPLRSVLVERTVTSPGGYGYFLSRTGAEKLFRFVERDGFFGDLDWRLVAYSTERDLLTSLDQASLASTALKAQWRIIGGDERLRSYAMFPCLVEPGRKGSQRLADNRRRHVQRAEAEPT